MNNRELGVKMEYMNEIIMVHIVWGFHSRS